jgi:hypothetical protein
VITVRSGIFLVNRPRAIPNYDTLLPDLPRPFAPEVSIVPLLVELTPTEVKEPQFWPMLYSCALLRPLVNLFEKQLKDITRHERDLVQLGLNILVTGLFVFLKDRNEVEFLIEQEHLGVESALDLVVWMVWSSTGSSLTKSEIGQSHKFLKFARFFGRSMRISDSSCMFARAETAFSQ